VVFVHFENLEVVVELDLEAMKKEVTPLIEIVSNKLKLNEIKVSLICLEKKSIIIVKL
jgi:hypothetical protein